MSLAWYPWYPGDYATDTQDLSCCEHGCYRLLLDAFWSRGPLTDDLNRLCRLAAGCDPETVRFVLETYWTRDDRGLWVNQRMDEVRREQDIKHQRRVRSGSRGGSKKAENRRILTQMTLDDPDLTLGSPSDDPEQDTEYKEVSSNATAMLEHCSTNQNQNQIKRRNILADATAPAETDEQPEKKKTSTAAMERFEQFWSLYPRKVKKKDAMTKWRGLRVAQQLDAIEHIGSQPFADRELKYIPHPTTYLNGEQWDDGEKNAPIDHGFGYYEV